MWHWGHHDVIVGLLGGGRKRGVPINDISLLLLNKSYLICGLCFESLQQTQCALDWLTSTWCPEALEGTSWWSWSPNAVTRCCSAQNEVQHKKHCLKKNKRMQSDAWISAFYLMLEFSGMFMMWSSASLLGFCCCGEQDLNRGTAGSVSMCIKCFSDASSISSLQSEEPGLVPVKPQSSIFHQRSALRRNDLTLRCQFQLKPILQDFYFSFLIVRAFVTLGLTIP